MTYQEIASMIDEIGYPNAYRAFDDDSGQQPPFIVFYYPGDDDFSADDCNYQTIRPLIIEFYTDHKDFAGEKKIEDALKAHSISYSRDETYIQSERMHEVLYQTDIVITE